MVVQKVLSLTQKGGQNIFLEEIDTLPFLLKPEALIQLSVYISKQSRFNIKMRGV